MTLEQTVKEIQDAMIVMGELQVRQSRVQKEQAQELDALRTTIREGLAAHNKRMQDHDKLMQELDEWILKLVSGIGELLRK
jgi:hypothetical protein